MHQVEKTTLLAALIGEVASHERIVAVEDVRELRASHPHLVSLEARQANTDGVGAVDLSQLVRACLRMRPDRIVVGECRGAEVRELLAALNTGHSGSMATVHVNNLASVPARLTSLGQQAGLGGSNLAAQVDAAIDLVVIVEHRAGRRRIRELGTLHAVDGELTARPLVHGPLASEADTRSTTCGFEPHLGVKNGGRGGQINTRWAESGFESGRESGSTLPGVSRRVF